MTTGDLIGWLAAALSLLTFSMRSMVALRLAALATNLCFVSYGLSSGLLPVIVLHSLLIPCNLYRLLEFVGQDAARQPVPGDAGIPTQRPGAGRAESLCSKDRSAPTAAAVRPSEPPLARSSR